MANGRRQQQLQQHQSNWTGSFKPLNHYHHHVNNSSLAAKAIRASSSSYRDSSLSSAYNYPSSLSSIPSSSPPPSTSTSSSIFKVSSKPGFWGVLARKAKDIINENNDRRVFELTTRSQNYDHQTTETQNRGKTDNDALQKSLNAITSSLSYLGGTIGNALEEGLTVVENTTADIIQETRKMQIKRKDTNSNTYGSGQQQTYADLETQLMASREVAMVMAAKAKLLIRELKTVKADLAFAKEWSGQLEEENRILRESSGKRGSPEDDDLIRLQLETLLAEKARLAQENSVFARENRFLKEIVEYHQLKMQDIVYIDEHNENVTEVYPIKVPIAQSSRTNATSLPSPVPPPAAQRANIISAFQVPPL